MADDYGTLSIRMAGVDFDGRIWAPGQPIRPHNGLIGCDSETTRIKNRRDLPEVVMAGFASDGWYDLVPWQYLPQYLADRVWARGSGA